MQYQELQEKSFELKLHSLVERRWRNKLILFYKIVNGLLPNGLLPNLYSYLKFASQQNYHLRSAKASKIGHISRRMYSRLKSLFYLTV